MSNYGWSGGSGWGRGGRWGGGGGGGAGSGAPTYPPYSSPYPPPYPPNHPQPQPAAAAAHYASGMLNFQWTACQFGHVPPDAVRAGMDKNGEPVYVGRAYHEGDIVPAKIVPSHRGAYVPWGGHEHKKDYYEALCAHHVSWVPDANGSVPPNAVAIGTTREGERLFVGRVMHDGTLTPGKIQTSHGCCYIPYGGREMSFPQYEVLVIFP